MVKTCRSIVFRVREAKAKLLQKPPRRFIPRIVSGEQRSSVHRIERVGDDRVRCFGRVSLAPLGSADVKSDLVNCPVGIARAQPATSDVSAGGEKEYRPVLNSVGVLGLHFVREPRSDLLRRERTTDEPSDGGVAPEFSGKREVGNGPSAKAEPGAAKKIAGRQARARMVGAITSSGTGLGDHPLVFHGDRGPRRVADPAQHPRTTVSAGSGFRNGPEHAAYGIVDHVDRTSGVGDRWLDRLEAHAAGRLTSARVAYGAAAGAC